ncbi:DUF1285 domain-containing protein [Virgifigura deserti]|uniref:DUF1285 domain-containing protein n=1 Tax=Virgifigura deserti TaxID=2268457 RepID=UPI003CCC0268
MSVVVTPVISRVADEGVSMTGRSDPTDLLKQMGAAAAADQSQSHPPQSDAEDAGCGDFDIRIGRDGTWFYHGSPIGRKPLVRLFASVLRREADGGYYLVTPAERGRIVVEDAPFTAVELTVRGSGHDRTLSFRTNLDDEVTADTDHPIRVAQNPDTAEPSPYILVRDGLEALILRSVYYELVALGEQREIAGEEQYGVWSKGRFFPLGRLEEEG